jgi:hypothetical protein
MDAKAKARERWREKNKDYVSPNRVETARKASLKYYHKNKDMKPEPKVKSFFGDIPDLSQVPQFNLSFN